jgi:GT2 family glycosyltransferase
MNAEQDLLAEIEHLVRVIEDQQRAVAEATDEIRRSHATLGWRAKQRFDAIGGRFLRNRALREPYRMARRAFEIWVDHGLLFIFRFAARKIWYALQGRSLIVDDHEHVLTTDEREDDYQRWLKRRAKTEIQYDTMRRRIREFPETPLVSVVVPAGPGDGAALEATTATLKAQVYERWELCSAPTPAEALRSGTGSVIAFVDAGDRLSPEALYDAVSCLNAQPETGIVYTDQDNIDADGRRSAPFLKPDWSPELLLATNVLGPFTVLRRSVLEAAGGLRPDFGAGQVYDLMLRASEVTAGIAHLPKIHCHVAPRGMTLDAILGHHAASRDEQRAIEDALTRRGRPGRAHAIFTSRRPRCYATRFDLRGHPRVSIIIPTRDRVELLRTTIESILAKTDYTNYEIIVVDNGSTDGDTLAYLAAAAPPVRVHRWPHPFNYSSLNNVGVREAQGELLLFLNNDMEVIRPDWLRALVEYAQFPETGAVGAKLLYTDGTIQHAGVVLGLGGLAQHGFRLASRDSLGAPRLADLQRDCSVVTGACMMVPRRVFEEVGGFDEGMRIVLNDVDLCLRIRERKYRIVYTPHALLYHHEGASRGKTHPAADEQRFLERWSAEVSRVDPFYNPNLSDTRDDWSLKLD